MKNNKTIGKPLEDIYTLDEIHDRIMFSLRKKVGSNICHICGRKINPSYKWKSNKDRIPKYIKRASFCHKHFLMIGKKLGFNIGYHDQY